VNRLTASSVTHTATAAMGITGIARINISRLLKPNMVVTTPLRQRQLSGMFEEMLTRVAPCPSNHGEWERWLYTHRALCSEGASGIRNDQIPGALSPCQAPPAWPLLSIQTGPGPKRAGAFS
jgi:hypothetical protein